MIGQSRFKASSEEKKILVTRPVHQSEPLCQLIVGQGWQAVRFPVIEIQGNVSAEQSDKVLQDKHYQYLFFVSVNAVNFSWPLVGDRIRDLQSTSCVAIGTATYNALLRCGASNVLLPVNGFNSEAVLAIPRLQNLNNQSCLIIRGVGGRETLAEVLCLRGAHVDYLEVYRRTLPKFDQGNVEGLLRDNLLTAIVIYSGDALHNLIFMLARPEIKTNLLGTLLVVISQRVYGLAKKIGFKKIIIAEHASDVAMINALLKEEERG